MKARIKEIVVEWDTGTGVATTSLDDAIRIELDQWAAGQDFVGADRDAANAFVALWEKRPFAVGRLLEQVARIKDRAARMERSLMVEVAHLNKAPKRKPTP